MDEDDEYKDDEEDGVELADRELEPNMAQPGPGRSNIVDTNSGPDSGPAWLDMRGDDVSNGLALLELDPDIGETDLEYSSGLAGSKGPSTSRLRAATVEESCVAWIGISTSGDPYCGMPVRRGVGDSSDPEGVPFRCGGNGTALRDRSSAPGFCDGAGNCRLRTGNCGCCEATGRRFTAGASPPEFKSTGLLNAVHDGPLTAPMHFSLYCGRIAMP